MLQLDKLTPITKKRKKLGRGGDLGGTSGRGHKGQKARTGGRFKVGPLFEGGQMPLNRRIPRRGFNNKLFERKFVVVNLDELDKRFESGDIVNLDSLKSKNIVKGKGILIKILGQGELAKKLTIYADAFSEKALQLIQKAGGMAVLTKESGSGSTTA